MPYTPRRVGCGTLFDALEIAKQMIAALRVPAEKLDRIDRDETKQLRRAASSVAHNLSEGRRRMGKDRIQLFRIAEGSAAEVQTSLDVAVAWGWLQPDEIASARELCDRTLAMLWRLTH